MKGDKNYTALTGLMEISKTIKISNNSYDVLPVSYKSIQRIISPYLFSQDKSEFYKNLITQSNIVSRITDEFSPLTLATADNLLKAFLPACGRGILMEKDKFVNCDKIRNSAFLSSRWVDGDVEFLSFHDLLIYKICSEYLKKEDKKIFTITIGEEVRVSLTFSKDGTTATIKNCPSYEIDSIKSIINKRKLDKFSLEYFDELMESFFKIAKKEGEDLTFEDSFLSLLFSKVKLGQKEFLSSSWRCCKSSNNTLIDFL